MPTLLDVRIITGHNNRPRFVYDCLRPGAILPVSLTLAEFIAACEEDSTSLSPIILGGEVFDRSLQPSVSVDDDTMPF